MNKQTRGVLVVLGFCAALFFFANIFLGYRRAHDPAHLRQTMANAANDSCRNSPELKRGASGIQVTSYCNCVVDSELRSMSDAEVEAAARRGTPDAADRAKMTVAALSCRARLHGGL